MTVRAKMFVEKRIEDASGYTGVHLKAVQAVSGEDSIFGKYTPNGELTIQTIQPVLAAPFAPRSKWYIDFHGEADEAPTPDGASFSCLLRCVDRTAYGEGDDNVAVRFSAVKREGNEEDLARFGPHPHHHGQMTIMNPAAAGQLVKDAVYLAVFSPAEA